MSSIEETTSVEPVETVESEVEAPTSAEESSQSSEETGDENPGTTLPEKKKKSFSERVGELTRQRNAVERIAEEAINDAAFWKARALSVGKVENPDPAKYEAGEQDARYIADLAAHRLYEKQTEQVKQVEQDFEQRREAQNKAAFAAQAEAIRSSAPDFDAVVSNPNLVVSEQLYKVILESDRKAEVAYYIGKNPELAARLSHMPPTQAAREIGRIEATLAMSPTRKQTSAPAPIVPVSSPSFAERQLGSMSLDDVRAKLGIPKPPRV